MVRVKGLVDILKAECGKEKVKIRAWGRIKVIRGVRLHRGKVEVPKNIGNKVAPLANVLKPL